ncbi:DUF58 domain-containing protein [Winogradskyella sp. DF17]|uniref:DUF58 domain-containing protein n=1 Tax=Winogradskyella pelagia TaxID=2819984 RepID=A0ABS3T3Y5_9FLAO|nr:DUF58 domain-containing protein [Winogradskyella sp. DF17]MBO3117452.1 DUF58 domain-containing protein [Winogradskyella sp. DF17]
MPKERITSDKSKDRKGPKEVYVTLQDLIKLQFEARGFSFLPKYAVQSILSGRHRSKLRGRGLDFDEVRKYIPGDDIRNIDWKVTARVGVTHTKEFTEEKERPVLFVVDQGTHMFFGSKLYFKSVIAAHLAALGAWRTLEVGDRVGGLVFNGTKDYFVMPKRNRQAVQRFLSRISEFNQVLSTDKVTLKFDNPLLEALKKTNEVVTHDYLVVVLSDLNYANDQVIKQLIRLKKNNDVIFGHVWDPLEKEILAKKITLSDGEYQILIAKDKTLKNNYKKAQAALLQKTQEDFKKYGIPFLSFSTLESPAHQLRALISSNKRKR